MSDDRCRCLGYLGCGHAEPAVTPSSDCDRWAIEPSGLCCDCDVRRYAAIGRAAERLHELLTERASK